VQLLTTAIVMVLLPLSTAMAQEGTGLEYSEQIDITEFRPATGVEEQVSASLMVTLAYAFIWLVLAGFVFSVWRRGRKLSAEMEVAQQRLAELDGKLAEHVDSGEEW